MRPLAVLVGRPRYAACGRLPLRALLLYCAWPLSSWSRGWVSSRVLRDPEISKATVISSVVCTRTESRDLDFGSEVLF